MADSDYLVEVCHGCGILSSFHRDNRQPCFVCAAISKAIAAERERCAKIAETAIDPSTGWVMLASQVPAVIAKMIRSGQ